jgi:predicted PurR-regulated permease PerM
MDMLLKRQAAFWLAALAVFVAVLWLLHDVLLPFVAGMVLAYLFDPLANRLERLGLGRFVAAFVIIGIFLLLLIVMIILLAPILIGQLGGLADNLPGYVSRLQTLVTDPSRPWLTKMLGAGFADAEIGDLVKQATGGLIVLSRSLWSGGQALLSLFSLVVVTPVVAFYLMCDWRRMVTTIDGWLPRHQASTIRMLAAEIDGAIAGYIRGQSGICLILGSLYATGLSVIGLHFGLLIGVMIGIASFVPYVGSLTGFVVAVGIAIAQFWPEGAPIAAVIAVCLVCQFIEGYVLAPYMVGRVVGLHPVWLLFALFAFGYWFGVVGLLLAIPLAAAVGVLARFGLRRYLASPLYTGEGPA